MGVTKDGKKALMLVSSNVRRLFGDGVCVVGSETCQLLALEPGLPETFVYGASERTYRIELLKIHLVKTDELQRAPLGNRSGERRTTARIRSARQAPPAASAPPQPR